MISGGVSYHPLRPGRGLVVLSRNYLKSVRKPEVKIHHIGHKKNHKHKPGSGAQHLMLFVWFWLFCVFVVKLLVYFCTLFELFLTSHSLLIRKGSNNA